MEYLIQQAFLHVEVIGPHVNEGHYDLVGPNGDIILPQVWESIIEPDWTITMHMWPIPEPPPPQTVEASANPDDLDPGRPLLPPSPGKGPLENEDFESQLLNRLTTKAKSGTKVNACDHTGCGKVSPLTEPHPYTYFANLMPRSLNVQWT